MGTFLIFFLALIVIAGLLFLATSLVFGRGEEMAPAPPDSTPVELPDDRPVSGPDVRGLRLSVVLRGYRMGEVDWVLDQLARTLDERDDQLADRDRQLAEWTKTSGQAATVTSVEPDDAEAAEMFVGPLPRVVTVELAKEHPDG